MTHYSRRDRDCSRKGHEHTWSEPMARNYNTYVKYEDGEPYLVVKWEKYKSCLTEFEYHTGGRTGSVIEARGCQIKNDIEYNKKKIPLNEFEDYNGKLR